MGESCELEGERLLVEVDARKGYAEPLELARPFVPQGVDVLGRPALAGLALVLGGGTSQIPAVEEGSEPPLQDEPRGKLAGEKNGEDARRDQPIGGEQPEEVAVAILKLGCLPGLACEAWPALFSGWLVGLVFGRHGRG